MVDTVTREQVLGHRVRAQQLDRAPGAGTALARTAILDIGVQDTGPDGGRWALALRGVDVAALGPAELVAAWTIRGAPHLYRRKDLPGIAAATRPFSDADACKRILNAARPLRAAGIGGVAALDAVAAAMRAVVTRPTPKGDVSTRLTELMDEPYRRFCRPCDAVHLYELPFRLAALRAGLELRPGTSPPVLEPIPDFHPADTVPRRFDVIRAYLHLLGPATPKHVAGYLDSTVKDVTARWPTDAVEVSVEGQTRWALPADADDLRAGPARTTRLLGPYDLFLQGKDRELLTDDPARVKALWPVLGRPGAVLVDGGIVGTWRPRRSGSRFRVALTLWDRVRPPARAEIDGEAERLAAFRGIELTGIDLED